MSADLKAPRWHTVLLTIYHTHHTKCYGRFLYKRVKGSLTYFQSIMTALHLHGLIELIPKGNKKLILLTKKGETIAQALSAIHQELT